MLWAASVTRDYHHMTVLLMVTPNSSQRVPSASASDAGQWHFVNMRQVGMWTCWEDTSRFYLDEFGHSHADTTTEEVTAFNTYFFLLLFAEECAGLFSSVSVTHYLLLCIEEECPKALTFCFHPWFGQSQALCQLSRLTTVRLSSSSTAKAPPVLAQAPQFTLHGPYPLSCD